MLVYYAYPLWHTVSFSLVAKKHIEYMRAQELAEVHEVDEKVILHFVPSARGKLVIHPAFFIMHRILQTRTDLYGRFHEEYWEWWRSKWDEVIGIDVADSDRYSDYAVELANRCDKLVVPSSFCVETAKRSGVRAKVYRVPHGVDPEWYIMPNIWETLPVKYVNLLLLRLYLEKVKTGKKYLLFFLWHSAERKGWPEVRAAYEKLAKERRDVVLVMKTMGANVPEFAQVMHLGAVNVYGWLDDYEKMALYDLADVTLVFSRGGGFELSALESLARGTPCVTSDWGAWIEYVPRFLQVKRGKRVQPLPNNALHSGYGYAVDVEKAVDKLHDILDNLDEYRAKTLEWRDKVLKNEYRWDLVAEKLASVLTD